jgi:hypothetical protein
MKRKHATFQLQKGIGWLGDLLKVIAMLTGMLVFGVVPVVFVWALMVTILLALFGTAGGILALLMTFLVLVILKKSLKKSDAEKAKRKSKHDESATFSNQS